MAATRAITQLRRAVKAKLRLSVITVHKKNFIDGLEAALLALVDHIPSFGSLHQAKLTLPTAIKR
jgi:hypothetical protein